MAGVEGGVDPAMLVRPRPQTQGGCLRLAGCWLLSGGCRPPVPLTFSGSSEIPPCDLLGPLLSLVRDDFICGLVEGRVDVQRAFFGGVGTKLGDSSLPRDLGGRVSWGHWKQSRGNAPSFRSAFSAPSSVDSNQHPGA